jgi:hypothetical protein
MTDTTRLLAQLRAVLDLTNTEIQVAETRVVQARTDAVRRELSRNAENGRDRAKAIESAIRELGGTPDVIGPFIGRAQAAVKALTEQAQPFDEALLGDLALEGQLLDRARYLKALAVAAGAPGVQKLADRLITAHAATVDWLTTVLAEDALGGPAALRRTPMQAVVAVAVRLANLPMEWSVHRADRALQAVSRGAHAGEVAAKAMATSIGILDPRELPIAGYDDLNVSDAVAAVKDLDEPADIRTVIAYEEVHKNRQRVVSAAQTRVAAIAQEIVGID